MRDIAPSYLTAFVIALAVYFFKFLMLPCYMVLILQVFAGIIVGFAFSEIFKFEEYNELKAIVLKIIKKNN